MTAFAVVTTVIILTCMYLGFHIIFLVGRNRIHWLFFILCGNISWWVFAAYHCFSAVTAEDMTLWFRLAAISFSVFPALNLNFYLELTAKRFRPVTCFLIYAPVPMVLWLTFTSHGYFSDFSRNGGSWYFIPAVNDPWFYFHMLYIVSYLTASMVLLVRWGEKSGSVKIAKQSRVIVGSVIACIFLCLGSDLVLPLFPWYQLPPAGPFLLIIYFQALYYAVLRYRFLQATPPPMADEIMANIHAPALFLDGNCTVIMANGKCGELLKVDARSLIGKKLSDIARIDGMEDTLKRIAAGETPYHKMRLTYRTPAATLTTDTICTGIRDGFGDLTGLLLISRAERDAAGFMSRYHITERQVEIIRLAAEGLTNREIGERLGITERTVETHLTHIYNRLDINGRIELLNTAQKLGLLSG